jgi:hypothetical protein
MKKPRIEGVGGKWVLKGGSQTLEAYATKGDEHTNELMIVYLPGPGILVEADSYTPAAQPATPPPPPAPSADGTVPAPPPPPDPAALALWDNLQRLKITPRTIAPVHGRGAVPYYEFLQFIGKTPTY